MVLQFLAGDAAEFAAKALDQFLGFLEIVHVAAVLELVAITPIFCAQGQQTAARRPAYAFADGAAAGALSIPWGKRPRRAGGARNRERSRRI